MDDEGWRPLFLRECGERSEFDVLHDGVPRWLEGSLWRWLMDRVAEGGPALILRLERRLHVELAADGDRPLGRQHTPPNALLERHWTESGPEGRLTLLDAILRDMQYRERAAIEDGDDEQAGRLLNGAQRLDAILAEGGSLWGAHPDVPAWCLVRRVNDTTAELVNSVTTPGTDAARKMKSSWTACFRHDPDYDIAYRDAVLAVEAVAIPLALPSASKATLGTVIAHIRDTVGRWSVGALDAAETASGDTLLLMLKTLWHNQERHARADGTIANVSRDEAETAVSLAITLVHWFTSGLVTRVDP